MKINTPKEDDELLSLALRGWDVRRQLPPRFQDEVWRRIACAEAKSAEVARWCAFSHWLNTLLARLGLSAACIAVLLMAGSSAGYLQVRREASQLNQTLGLRYVQAVDPYQAPRTER